MHRHSLYLSLFLYMFEIFHNKKLQLWKEMKNASAFDGPNFEPAPCSAEQNEGSPEAGTKKWSEKPERNQPCSHFRFAASLPNILFFFFFLLKLV